MRAIRRAAPVALLGAVALALTVPRPPAAAATHPDGLPPRHGDSAFRAHLSPTVIAPGGRVMLIVSGCHGDTTVSSGVFTPVTVHPRSGTRTAVVDWDARPGAEYQVRFACADGAMRTIGLTIMGGHHGGPPPQHGVQAGLGGSLASFDLQQIAVGVLLLASALGLAYRRSRRHASGDTPPPDTTSPAPPTTP
ncbi:hypothetical protein [Streptomyces odontomachi]|uniref:hypothetical protein n=1 Tax=Streptomyces odontomachi TaxID=2944940 RepID=UPI00210C20A1|nr:hypothetical protein [Streptomyces sp. ODS25]